MEQRSKEWAKAREKKITASNFGRVLAGPSTKKHKEYLEELALNIAGVPTFEPESTAPWFQPGIDNEDEARGRFEWETGKDVEQVGIIIHPKHSFISCSPDGLVQPDAGLEIKCRSVYAQFLNAQKEPKGDYLAQIQGCMWIAERPRWFYVNYYKKNFDGEIKTDIHIQKIARDDNFIKKLEEACLSFWDKAEKRAKG